MKILVVDDEAYSLQVLADKIRDIMPDAVVQECEDGLHAWKEVQKTRYDIAFIDVTMQMMSGRELAVKIHKKYPDTQILFETGELDAEVLRQGIQIERCIYKPVMAEEIRGKIEQLATLPPFGLTSPMLRLVTEKQDGNTMNGGEIRRDPPLAPKKKIIPSNLWSVWKGWYRMKEKQKKEKRHKEDGTITGFYEELTKSKELQEKIH